MTLHVMPGRRDTPADDAGERRLVRASDRWLRLLLRLYPADFRDEMGDALLETYRDRCRAALRDGGVGALAGVWLRSLADSTRNGLAERMRPAVGWRRSGNWGRDTERAVRRLARAPLFTFSMLATLTVGLGAFAMVATVVQKVLLAPLPYERPDDLYMVWRDYGKVFDLKRGNLAGTDLVALAAAGGAIEGAAALDLAQHTMTAAGSGSDETAPEQIGVLYTTPNLFRMLGVRPALGRTFAPGEVGKGRPALVVLGHELWQRRFGGRRDVLGTDVVLDGQPHRVIGVMGDGFRLDGQLAADAYATHPVNLAETEPGAGSYNVMLRARPGTPPTLVASAVGAVGRMVDERDFEGKGISLYPVGVKADLLAAVRAPLLVLGAAGVLLVLVLGVNMATLLLVRAAQREREFAISRALGANRVALVRATLLEAALLGTAVATLAALAGVWGTRALVALAPLDLPRRATVAVDWRLAALAAAAGALLGALAGAPPAGGSTRAQLATLLRNAAVRGGGGGFGPLRRAMVVAQVALSLVLLSAGGLVVRSFDRLLRVDPGFSPAGVLTFGVPVPGARYPSDTLVLAVHERLHRELAAIPGVTAVGAASALPLAGDPSQTTVRFPSAPGNTGDEERDRPLVDFMPTRAGYFEALGIRVLAGRAFAPTPTRGVREAVIDRTLARQFFPTGGAVGATFRLLGDTLLVVGVVEHARLRDVHQDGRPQVYLRDENYTDYGLSFAVRTDRAPTGLVPEVRAAVARVDPQLAVANVRSMDEIVSAAVQQPRLSAVLLSGFSLGALLLAAMGLYGVIAGSVSRRRHEIAVRLALGSDHGRVLRLVLGEGARLVALGVLVGAPGIYLASRVVDGVLVGVSPFDPLTLGAVTLGLAAVAAVACYLPARRVAAIEPAQSLLEN
ncbi:ADOP family duplicated permease [Roseisolibacter sp. H3M3-2]|uniref:ADOP family duplicated permease n=1 Tax=Roseisolibacter sp. H3M3-2 TaxID=3031323 RepID=UPI0023DAC4F1|nr:ADOP family duplicated permease [Roseisolibacter sp. H3M3-2]MDF1504591.1 ADOP family duplicated permease [Roseisolibacter sp. H3M3-2]